MSDFDEMRLVFKVEAGYVWRCPCGLGAKSPASSAGKARTGARDHINRRHAKPTPEQVAAAQSRGRHASGMDPEDYQFVADAARRASLRFELLSNPAFMERSQSGLPGRFSPGTLAKLGSHYRFTDHVLLLPGESELPARTWMPIVDGLAERGYAILYDVPDWKVIGPKTVLVGLTRIPEGPCQAYVNGMRMSAVPPAEGACLYRPCPNRADHLVVIPEQGSKAKAVRVALCRLHRRTYVRKGYDLSIRGGPDLVEFEAGGPVELPPPAVQPSPPAPVPTPAASQPPPVPAPFGNGLVRPAPPKDKVLFKVIRSDPMPE